MTESEIPYRFDSLNEHSIITILPGLNNSEWADFEKVGSEVLDRLNTIKDPLFLIDLTPLSYMGSAMVALIVRLWKSVKDGQGKMVVVCKDKMVYEVLKLAGLHTVWTIVETRDEGVHELGLSREAIADKNEARLLTWVGPVAVVGAAAGLALYLSPAEVIPIRAVLTVMFGFAAIGLVVGTICAIKETDWQRKAGIAVILASIGLGIGGVFSLPVVKEYVSGSTNEEEMDGEEMDGEEMDSGQDNPEEDPALNESTDSRRRWPK